MDRWTGLRENPTRKPRTVQEGLDAFQDDDALNEYVVRKPCTEVCGITEADLVRPAHHERKDRAARARGLQRRGTASC